MPKLHVLVSEQGDVLGTVQESVGAAAGAGAPAGVGFRAGPGQRVVELDVDEATARLDPEALHSKIKSEHLG
ncbi:MAG: hypothetical protein WB592_07760 [Acidimicrobiales bacterium]